MVNQSALYSRSLSILHIISGDIWAGAEVQVYHTLCALNKIDKVSVTCILFNEGILENKLKNKNIKTIVIDENRSGVLSMAYTLRRIIKEIKPDIIHVHAVKEHFLARFSVISLVMSAPIVRTVHGSRGVPKNLILSRHMRSSLVVYLDNFMISRSSDAVIAVSKDLEDEFINLGIKGKLVQIYNAIDIDEYNVESNASELRKIYGVDDRFWIGTAARLVEPKNIQMLIESGIYLAGKGIPFKISIFGDGPLKDVLQSQIIDNDLTNCVELHGFEQKISSVINSLDVFVLCSLNEGLPMALLEAMFMRTPVVCTEVGGMKEIISNDINGLLVPSRNSRALAQAFVALYEDREKAAKLADNARETIENKFALSKNIRQLKNLYSQLLH